VDRSATYAVRWVAKSLVANGFCDRVMVEIAYGIGVSQPISIYVNSYNTAKKGYNDEDLQNIILRNFDLRPGCIIRDLRLKRPIYR
jgi:S-adenosylmethionine synthetase